MGCHFVKWPMAIGHLHFHWYWYWYLSHCIVILKVPICIVVLKVPTSCIVIGYLFHCIVVLKVPKICIVIGGTFRTDEGSSWQLSRDSPEQSHCDYHHVMYHHQNYDGNHQNYDNINDHGVLNETDHIRNNDNHNHDLKGK